MKVRLFFCFCLIFPALLCAQRGVSPVQGRWPLVVGAEGGLYGIDSGGNALVLWSGGAVRKILRGGDYWAILSDSGILVSSDLVRWESRNEGLPVKTIKVYEGGEKSFISLVQEIKDLEIHPENPDIMVCATKDQVFFSQNAGRNWKNLGAPPYRTNGIKAVAVADLPELTVFLSHSVYGVYYITPEKKDGRWTELNRGLEKLETTDNPDEVSDMAVAFSGENPELGSEGRTPVIYASQTFRRRLYRLDWEGKQFLPIWSDSTAFGTTDSLDIGRGTIRFVREGAVIELNYPGLYDPAGLYPLEPLYSRYRPDIVELIETVSAHLEITPLCLTFQENIFRPDSEFINLSELWLVGTPNTDPATGEMLPEDAITLPQAGREGLYLPVNHAMDNTSLKPYLDLIHERALNMVVIDMKDDYGRLRFTPQNPAITEKGRVFRPLDIDEFLKDMKEQGIYTAARIVVFKDPELARKEGGKLAVWDRRNNKAWAGYYDVRRKKAADAGVANNVEILPDGDPEYEIVRTYYDERWVDPYSEEVWEYTAAIAVELHERGFDEIQFDYIRFPTDGANLADARYRWQEQGMDMESAILSFLRHIRSRLDAPISVDIYGANGWYRTGARTGQEVELMAPYVDVICPMYYPSHFEQDFLAQDPPELRPYRIYYLGTQRTARIARGQVVVRPYAQAFYLNVSYDRKYYNPDYVRLQMEGVRDATNTGLTYWNNSGRYDDIPLPGSGEEGS
ncbi:MAG: putative glycoside hydrolase [Treponema sp.]|nr:putative glycoside hydrolase [Treponema sp.]